MSAETVSLSGMHTAAIIGESTSTLRRSGALLVKALTDRKFDICRAVMGAPDGPAFEYVNDELVPELATLSGRTYDHLHLFTVNAEPNATMENTARETFEVIEDESHSSPVLYFAPPETGLQEAGQFRRIAQRYGTMPPGSMRDAPWRFDRFGDQLYLFTGNTTPPNGGRAAGNTPPIHPYAAVGRIVPTIRELLRHTPDAV